MKRISEPTLLLSGALLYETRKISISDTIPLKPGQLSDDEGDLMRQHPYLGTRISEGIPFLEEALRVIRHQQEWWDGSGYAMGSRGRELLFPATIFAVTDVKDAITSDRRCRGFKTVQEALAHLQPEAEIQLDAELVATLVEPVSEGEAREHRPV
jgi:HD-GYP domain-containing protein (c-di-GMP phosphodiesterase class II)